MRTKGDLAKPVTKIADLAQEDESLAWVSACCWDDFSTLIIQLFPHAILCVLRRVEKA